MASITFVKWAGGKLSKKFTGAGETQAPLAKTISSYTKDYSTIEEFHEAIVEAAEAGHAMFSGSFKHDLRSESRSGKFVQGIERDWICLDLDGMQADSIEEVIANIPEFKNTSYVVQYSNSHGLTKPGMNAHVWFLLDTPLHQDNAMYWLQSINYMDAFSGGLGISATATSLSYPIDITLAQESRLIYIAPPIITEDSGYIDPFADVPRIQLVRKRHERVRMKSVPKLRFDKDVIEMTKLSILNGLREQYGFARIAADQVGDWIRPEVADGIQVIPRSEVQTDDKKVMRCDIIRTFPDGTKMEGTKMSWWFEVGYIDDSTLLYNFKGEPPLYLKDSAPEFTAEWNSKYADESLPDLGDVPEFLFKTPKQESGGRFPLEGVWKSGQAFFARDMEKDEYLGVRVKPDGTGFIINKVSRTTAPNFAHNFGAKLDKETFTRCHSVRRVKVLNPAANVFRDDDGNLCLNEAYIPDVLLMDITANDRMKPEDAVTVMEQATPLLYRYLMHTLGSEETMARFLNWAMCHIRGINVQTAWLLRGTPGSGKSSIVTQILTRLLTDGKSIGYSPTIALTQDKLMDEKNGYLTDYFFIEATEFNDRGLNAQGRAALTEKLKQLVSEEFISIRKMQTDTYNARNITAFVVTSNESVPFELPKDDRRFEIPPYVSTSAASAFPELAINSGGTQVLPENFFSHHIEKEMEVFTRIMASLKLVPKWVSSAATTDAKRTMAEGGEDTEVALARWLTTGNLDELAGAIADAIDGEEGMDMHPDAKLAKDFIGVAARNPAGATLIPVEHMQAIYRLLFPHYAKSASVTAVAKVLNRRSSTGVWPKVHPAAGKLTDMGYDIPAEARPRAFEVLSTSAPRWKATDYMYWTRFAQGTLVDKPTAETHVLPFLKKKTQD
jgi:hypothetical protein